MQEPRAAGRRSAASGVPLPWIGLPTHRAWLEEECRRLLAFGHRAAHPAGGAVWLDADGAPDPRHGVQTWITCRTVHVYSLGTLLGVPGCRPIAEQSLAGLAGPLRDDWHGGWFSRLAPDGRHDRGGGKSCYDHAFVLLAAASATIAGVAGARDLLAEAQEVFTERFWDDEASRCVDAWDADWQDCQDYRGLNANMHATEALLAVADVDDDPVWRARAGRIAAFVVDLAAAHDDRLPEHFDASWSPDLQLNADRADDPFQPYGATVGHGLEWARLLLTAEAALGELAPEGLPETAQRLFDRAVADGWRVDGAPGFVYTTDWSGTPVVRTRMHWVVAEAIAAAAALYRRTGDPAYADHYATWWDYAATHLRDPEHGSWHHELDPGNHPAATVWPGKPDLYHAVQATLLPRLPLAPTITAALARGLLD